MTPLPDTFTKNGFTYEKVTRSGNVAIYKQRLRPGVGELAYEVFHVKQVPESVMFGKVVAAHEAGPSNEDFGFRAFSFSDLPRAKARMQEMLGVSKR